MKLSKYIVTKKIEDGYVLFSTISKKIIQVNKNFYNELLDINPNNLREIKTNELTYLLNSSLNSPIKSYSNAPVTLTLAKSPEISCASVFIKISPSTFGASL